MSDRQGGMHFFCFYPCDDFICLPNEPIVSRKEGEKVFDMLAN